MKKLFNITGLCIKDKHYMVDITNKINQIVPMVERGDYFTINRPRQFGKTTTLNVLKEVLSKKYLVIKTSFEGVGDNLFKSEEEFCSRVFKTFAESVKFTDKKTYELLIKYNTSKNFTELSSNITDFILETGMKVVLLIDEVDKNSSSRTFLQFLGLLRNKYLLSNEGEDITFQSVVLAGVRDICKIIDETLNAVWTEESVYTAVKTILLEKNTLFEDVIKNIENNEDIKVVVEEMLIHGKRFEYHPMVHDKGIMYGIFRRDDNRLAIHNSIFETYIYTYLVGMQELKRPSFRLPISDEKELSTDTDLYMDKILLKFRDFMFEEFRKQDEKFYESQARLIFLAYLKPILNGKGFYFVEPQTRENKRLDVVVIYGKQKYVIELKIWNGENTMKKA